MCTYSTALAFAADGLAERRHVAWGTAFKRRARALQAAGYTRLRVVLGQHRRRVAPVHAREIARGWHTLALWMSRQNVALPARCAACVCHVRASVTGRVAAHACGHTHAHARTIMVRQVHVFQSSMISSRSRHARHATTRGSRLRVSILVEDDGVDVMVTRDTG